LKKRFRQNSNAQTNNAPTNIPDGKLRRVKNGNHDNRAQIVYHGERGQKYFQRSGDAVAENRQNAERESDVGCHRNSDSGLCFRSGVEKKMNQRRRGNSAERGKNRQQRIFEIRQFAVVKLAFEFQADEQKKTAINPSLTQCSTLRPPTYICQRLK